MTLTVDQIRSDVEKLLDQRREQVLRMYNMDFFLKSSREDWASVGDWDMVDTHLMTHQVLREALVPEIDDEDEDFRAWMLPWQMMWDWGAE